MKHKMNDKLTIHLEPSHEARNERRVALDCRVQDYCILEYVVGVEIFVSAALGVVIGDIGVRDVEPLAEVAFEALDLRWRKTRFSNGDVFVLSH